MNTWMEEFALEPRADEEPHRDLRRGGARLDVGFLPPLWPLGSGSMLSLSTQHSTSTQ